MNKPDIHPLRASLATHSIEIVDQTRLPGELKIVSLSSVSEAAQAIRTATEDARIASAEQRKLLAEMHAAAQVVARGIAQSRGL